MHLHPPSPYPTHVRGHRHLNAVADVVGDREELSHLPATTLIIRSALLGTPRCVALQSCARQLLCRVSR